MKSLLKALVCGVLFASISGIYASEQTPLEPKSSLTLSETPSQDTFWGREITYSDKADANIINRIYLLALLALALEKSSHPYIYGPLLLSAIATYNSYDPSQFPKKSGTRVDRTKDVAKTLGNKLFETVAGLLGVVIIYG